MDSLKKYAVRLERKTQKLYTMSIALRLLLGFTLFLSVLPDSALISSEWVKNYYPLITTFSGLTGTAIFIIIKATKIQELMENYDQRLLLVHQSLAQMQSLDNCTKEDMALKVHSSLMEIESKLRKNIFDDLKDFKTEISKSKS